MKWYSWIREGLQTLLGCIILLFLSGKLDSGLYKGRRLIFFDKGKFFSGTSLGFWIILPKDAGAKTIWHEYGHCLQSAKWGFLYLFVIGIPSLRNNLKARTCARTRENYYNLYPEKEADRLGGVVRL
jgi:hypothetical protein